MQNRVYLYVYSLLTHAHTLHTMQLALTAATPLLRGRVADSDVRWSVISQAVDDRTPGERGLAVSVWEMCEKSVRVCEKCRCHTRTNLEQHFGCAQCDKHNVFCRACHRQETTD